MDDNMIRVHTYSSKSSAKNTRAIGSLFFDPVANMILLKNIEHNGRTTFFDAEDFYASLGRALKAYKSNNRHPN